MDFKMIDAIDFLQFSKVQTIFDEFWKAIFQTVISKRIIEM